MSSIVAQQDLLAIFIRVCSFLALKVVIHLLELLEIHSASFVPTVPGLLHVGCVAQLTALPSSKCASVEILSRTLRHKALKRLIRL